MPQEKSGELERWLNGPEGFLAKANRQLDEIDRRTASIPKAPSQVPTTQASGDWFRIASSTQDGANNRWTYTAKRQVKSTTGYGGWADSTTDTADYVLYNPVEDGGDASGALAAESLVFAKRVTASDGTVEWWIIGGVGAVSGLFVVTLTQTGGSAGSEAAQCSFTYTATSLSGVELGTALSPECPRPSLGAMVAATKGTGYFNSTGTFTLSQAYEVLDVESC